LKTGCFNHKKGICLPLAFWTEQNIWDYLKEFNVPYCSIYDTGVRRTGCMFCMFGVHLEQKPNRFELMKATHPQLYDYCMNKLGIKEVLDYIGIDYYKKQKTVGEFHSTETHNNCYAVRKSEISSPKVLASPKPIA